MYTRTSVPRSHNFSSISSITLNSFSFSIKIFNMIISEAKNFIDASFPINYLNWIVGAGLLWPPRSYFFHILMNLYSIIIILFYSVIIYIAVTVTIGEYFYDSSPVAAIMYRVLGYTNAIVAISVPIVSRARREGLRGSMKRIDKLNDVFEKYLGIDKNYKNLIIMQINYITFILLSFIVITILDSVSLRGETTPFADYIITTIFHYPILLTLVADFTFCAYTRYVTKRFLSLNTILIGLNKSSDHSIITNDKTIFVTERIGKNFNDGETNNFNYQSKLLQMIRKTHLDLSKEAGEINLIFGLQNLISMGVSFVMITGLLYTIYSAIYWKHENHLNGLREIIPCSCWCIIYICKIIFISNSCARISEESQKSGEILFKIVGSVNEKEFNKEIIEFALQIIQNPVRLTACGFFILDHTYIQGVIGSVTTYLVILIQMSNISPSNSNVMGNKTET